MFGVDGEHRLGDLEDQVRCFDASGGDCIRERMYELVVLKLTHRQVDGNGNFFTSGDGLPGACLTAGLTQDPVADRDDHAVFFGEPNELVGCNKSSLWMFPSDQGLDKLNLAALEVEDWLEVEEELVLVQSSLEISLQIEALDRFFVHCFFEELKTALATILREVHGNVGVAHHRVDVAGACVVHGNADGCKCANIAVAKIDRLAENVERASGHVHRVTAIDG